MGERDQHLRAIFGEEKVAKVHNAKILVVGAGGIGCELLKNLALGGFRNIDVIDLDIIDVSNLNRQFLFRKEHVKMSKAEVACAATKKFNPDINITGSLGNILDSKYDMDFYRKYDLVMNALDNLTARRHVNRMCLAVDKPLIESGTAGYLGQATVIRKGQTECFECEPKPVQKSYPVCTIRSTPSQPIHCIVWAKYIFTLLFGAAGDEDSEYSPPLKKQGVEEVFDTLFKSSIVKLASMEELWKSRKTPKPLNVDVSNVDASDKARTALSDRSVWSLNENCTAFLSSLRALKARGTDCDFDKDDDDALDFVAAAANLRSTVFSIPPQTRWDIKAMAGNIIPAIATTNAIVAGLIVMEAYKVLSGAMEHCRTTYVNRYLRQKKLFSTAKLVGPNPKCHVCQSGLVNLSINVQTTTLDFFLKTIAMKELAFKEPTITLGSRILFEMGEDAEDLSQNLPKTLAALGATHGSVFLLEDFFQDMEVQLALTNKVYKETDEAQYEMSGDVPVAKEAVASEKEVEADDGNDDDVVEFVVARNRTKKRKADADDSDGTPAAKRRKVDDAVDVDAVVID